MARLYNSLIQLVRRSQHDCCAALLLLLCVPISAAIAQSDLDSLSLQQLMNVEITSASEKPQTLGEATGAIFIISAEDIRRSGVTSVAEALRMAPGVHVGRIDDTRWAVSARGFNDVLSNKLQVMMDGRHLYTPDFSGVFWSNHMPLIDNVERIEVIRGPGSVLWGSNAVNGVVNIVTRNARDTQGLFLQARGGNRDSTGFTGRYGGVTSGGWFYRFDVYGIKENITDSPLDSFNNDFLEQRRASFRVDGKPTENQSLQLQGSTYDGDSEEIVRIPAFAKGQPSIVTKEFDALSRGSWVSANWKLQQSPTSSWDITGYYQEKSREFSLGKYSQNTLSLQVKNRQQLGNRHDLSWGFGLRTNDMPFEERSSLIAIMREQDDYSHYEFYVQDEIKFSDKFSVTLGSKVEKSELAELEIQPSVKLSWQPIEALSLWASSSRSVRAPASGEYRFRVFPSIALTEGSLDNPVSFPISVVLNGGDALKSEELIAFEAGMKGTIGPVGFDLALFDFSYEDLLDGNIDGVFCQPSNVNLFQDFGCFFASNYLEARSTIVNNARGESRGLELALDWQPFDNWQLSGVFSFFDYDLKQVVASTVATGFINPELGVENASEPKHIFYVRSEWSIRENLELDLTVRSVDDSEVFEIDSYTTADLRLEWQPNSDFRVEIIGQNLLDSGHYEFGSRLNEAAPSMINSGVFARLTWAP